jgi:hypothetical protein
MGLMVYLDATWADGHRERVTVRTAKLLPWLAGHTYVVFGRTIRTRNPNAVWRPMEHGPTLRHELTHVRQYARYGWLGFLWQYYGPGGRTRQEMEREAKAHEPGPWPTYQVGG